MENREIAGYKVIHPLGAGGMGQVFLVQHPRLRRQDALKLLDVGVSRNHEFKARFQREADLLAGLSHPNIVTLYDRGEFEDQLWITMEYVDGTDASQFVTDHGPVSLDVAATVIGEAGSALDHAWRKQRITHRDVKPANILLSLDHDSADPSIEAAKLADFGIAKAAGETTSLTATGTTIGTMAYISPEAIEGRDLDNRADIYSLGCTAYHLLTGSPPFSGNSITALMAAHLNRPVPAISDKAPGLPARLNDVFAKVLAKDPATRYQSCAEFVADLRGDRADLDAACAATVDAATAPTVLRDTGSEPQAGADPAAAQRRYPIRRWLLLSGSAVIALITVVAVGLALRHPQRTTTENSTVESTAAAPSRTPAAAPPTTTVATTTTATQTTTATALSTAPFLGEWAQHATGVTLSPDGSAHYWVSSGAMNYSSWSASWSAATPTTAMVVLSEQLTSQGDIFGNNLNRYTGEAFMFGLLPSGYATITSPSGSEITLCPRGTGFGDPDNLCGA